MKYSIDLLKSVLNSLNHCRTCLIDGYNFRFPPQKCIRVRWANRRGKTFTPWIPAYGFDIWMPLCTHRCMLLFIFWGIESKDLGEAWEVLIKPRFSASPWKPWCVKCGRCKHPLHQEYKCCPCPDIFRKHVSSSLNCPMKSDRRWPLACELIQSQSWWASQQDHQSHKRRKWLSWGRAISQIWTRIQISSTCSSTAPLTPPTTTTYTPSFQSPQPMFPWVSVCRLSRKTISSGVVSSGSPHHWQSPAFFLFCLDALIPF